MSATVVPTHEITCTGCGNKMTVHEPGLARQVNPGISQVTMFPQWSLDERVCKHCGTVMAPVFGDLQIVWAGIGKSEEKPRIIVPNLVMPRDLQKVS